MSSTKYLVKLQYKDAKNINRQAECEISVGSERDIRPTIRQLYNDSNARIFSFKKIKQPSNAESSSSGRQSDDGFFAQLGKVALTFIAICIFAALIDGRGENTQKPSSSQAAVATPQDTANQDPPSQAANTTTSVPIAQLPNAQYASKQTANTEIPSNQPVIDQTAEVTAGNPIMGSALDESSQISSLQLTFSPKDTIYLAVPTSTPTSAITYGTLSVRWKYLEGSLYLEFFDETQRMQFSKDLVTIFKLSKPDGFPVGEYQAEIRLNSVAVHTVAFSVQ